MFIKLYLFVCTFPYCYYLKSDDVLVFVLENKSNLFTHTTLYMLTIKIIICNIHILLFSMSNKLVHTYLIYLIH